MTLTAVNLTKDKIIANSVDRADGYLTRLIGLMGRNGIPAGYGLWIEPCADIHSCFMRFDFDALFIDKEGRVLHTVQAMKPWRFSKFVRKGRSVLELPAGIIGATGTEIGDQIVIQ